MAGPRDLVAFYRSLAELLRAGVIVGDALATCTHLLPEAAALAATVRQGRPLSEALAQFPAVFPADQVRLIEIAERSGQVDATLGDLADYAAETIAGRRTVKGGLMYPAAILHLAAFIAPLPNLFLPPGVTGYVFSVFGFLAVLWGLVGAVLLFLRRASPERLDAVIQRLPVVRGAWRDLHRWRMASALRLLARTSMDVPASLRFAAGASRDVALSAALRSAADHAEHHRAPASGALAASGVLSPEVIALWRHAEITGAFETTFARLATRFAESFRQRMQTLATWLPRLAYAVVALGMTAKIFVLARAYLGHLDRS